MIEKLSEWAAKFAEADFTSSIERLGAGHTYGVVRKKDETDAEYEQRIIEAKKGTF